MPGSARPPRQFSQTPRSYLTPPAEHGRQCCSAWWAAPAHSMTTFCRDWEEICPCEHHFLSAAAPSVGLQGWIMFNHHLRAHPKAGTLVILSHLSWHALISHRVLRGTSPNQCKKSCVAYHSSTKCHIAMMKQEHLHWLSHITWHLQRMWGARKYGNHLTVASFNFSKQACTPAFCFPDTLIRPSAIHRTIVQKWRYTG